MVLAIRPLIPVTCEEKFFLLFGKWEQPRPYFLYSRRGSRITVQQQYGGERTFS